MVGNDLSIYLWISITIVAKYPIIILFILGMGT